MESSTAKKKKKVFDAKKKMQNMTKEQVKAALEKKKECNAKAMAIVERLIEPEVDEFWLLDNLIHINQCHFQDAVEERAVVKCCGYPLCDAVLKDIPRKQFHISTKQNKVFDITDRKNYCSNGCYKAGVFLKDQLFTSPLWLRDCEDVVTYKLYKPEPISGITGLEIDLGNTNPVKLENVEETDNKTAQSEKTEKDSCQNPVSNQFFPDSDSEDEFQDAEGDMEDISDKMETAAIHCTETDGVVKKDEYFLSSSSFSDAKGCITNRNEGIVKDSTIEEIAYGMEAIRVRESVEKKTDKRKSGEKQVSSESKMKKLKPNIPVGMKIEAFLMEWFTVESLTFIYGEDQVKEKFQKFGSPMNEIQFKKIKDTYMYERYEEICRRLNILEIKDRDEKAQPSKPLPDYDQLKLQAKELELKVRSFYKGDAKVGFVLDEEKDKKEKPDDEYGDSPPVLPLIDRHAIKAARRRIMLDKLNRTLPDIQSALNLSQFGLIKEIRELVHTLSLSPTNIVMKPSEWNLVALILIRIMTIRNVCLQQAYQSDLTQRRMVNLLMTYNLDLNFLERQVLNINDIEQIIRNSQ